MPTNKEKLQEQIKEQGEVVRKLKAAKESKEKVCVVDERGTENWVDTEKRVYQLCRLIKIVL